MYDRDLARRRFPETLEDGSSTWTWVAGGICLAFVLALLFTMSSGDRTQLASNAPPAIDGMEAAPITQPGLPSP